MKDTTNIRLSENGFDTSDRKIKLSSLFGRNNIDLFSEYIDYINETYNSENKIVKKDINASFIDDFFISDRNVSSVIIKELLRVERYMKNIFSDFIYRNVDFNGLDFDPKKPNLKKLFESITCKKQPAIRIIKAIDGETCFDFSSNDANSIAKSCLFDFDKFKKEFHKKSQGKTYIYQQIKELSFNKIYKLISTTMQRKYKFRIYGKFNIVKELKPQINDKNYNEYLNIYDNYKYQGTENLLIDYVESNINWLVKVRNIIAHGDPLSTKSFAEYRKNLKDRHITLKINLPDKIEEKSAITKFTYMNNASIQNIVLSLCSIYGELNFEVVDSLLEYVDLKNQKKIYNLLGFDDNFVEFLYKNLNMPDKFVEEKKVFYDTLHNLRYMFKNITNK